MRNRITSCVCIGAATAAITASGFAGACGNCDADGICDLQVGINGGFVQDCGDGQWVSLAYPFPGGFGDIDTVTSTHLTNTGLGSIYITGGTCDGPDVNNILATLCCAIENDGGGAPVDHCFPTMSTDGIDTVWVVMTFHTGFSFDVMYNSATVGSVGSAFGNLDGGGDPTLWQDLNDFGFGACYCVELSFNGCDPPEYICPGGVVQACCFSDGSCQDLTGVECTAAGGTAQGSDTACDTITCPETCGPGAGDCCTDGGNGTPGCEDTECCDLICSQDAFCCDNTWDGICAGAAQELCGVCQQPGACCLPNGECVFSDGIADCANMGGIFQGVGTGCDTVDCMGACCFSDGSCTMGGFGDCADAAGAFQGFGTTCDPNPCVPICGQGAGDCCVDNGTPGCDDVECCDIVCAQDAFCCDVAWDGLCADAAADLCTVCAPCPGECLGDLADPFGLVDSKDVGVLLGAWGTDDPCANLDGIGLVDGMDLGLLLGAWGPCPEGACSQCNGGGGLTCDLQVGINGGFEQTCNDGQWVSLAYPIQTGGAMIDTVSSVHNSNTGLGSIYICAGTCDGPDVGNILATLCCAIDGEPSGATVEHCFPEVATSMDDPTWIVMTFHTGFSFDVAYDSETIGGIGVAYGNLDGGGDPTLWQDLNDFGFGACYCVGLSFTDCDPPEYDCEDQPTGCDGAEGDCCVEGGNGSPGCDDLECCEIVCDADPFCCDTEWDGICAEQAVELCDICTGGGPCPGDGDCCESNGSPGCDDVECCELICAADPFCCENTWDGLCADAAMDQCAVCDGGGELPNDECMDAIDIFDGSTDFSTLDATTSAGFDLPPECDEGFGLALVNDIWYTYTATCTGTVTVSTCDSADYDTRLAAYTMCDPATLVACNDDGDGCGGFTSIMTFNAEMGATYLIRIGGFGGSGSGFVNISCN